MTHSRHYASTRVWLDARVCSLNRVSFGLELRRGGSGRWRSYHPLTTTPSTASDTSCTAPGRFGGPGAVSPLGRAAVWPSAQRALRSTGTGGDPPCPLCELSPGPPSDRRGDSTPRPSGPRTPRALAVVLPRPHTVSSHPGHLWTARETRRRGPPGLTLHGH